MVSAAAMQYHRATRLNTLRSQSKPVQGILFASWLFDNRHQLKLQIKIFLWDFLSVVPVVFSFLYFLFFFEIFYVCLHTSEQAHSRLDVALNP